MVGSGFASRLWASRHDVDERLLLRRVLVSYRDLNRCRVECRRRGGAQRCEVVDLPVLDKTITTTKGITYTHEQLYSTPPHSLNQTTKENASERHVCS